MNYVLFLFLSFALQQSYAATVNFNTINLDGKACSASKVSFNLYTACYEQKVIATVPTKYLVTYNGAVNYSLGLISTSGTESRIRREAYGEIGVQIKCVGPDCRTTSMGSNRFRDDVGLGLVDVPTAGPSVRKPVPILISRSVPVSVTVGTTVAYPPGEHLILIQVKSKHALDPAFMGFSNYPFTLLHDRLTIQTVRD